MRLGTFYNIAIPEDRKHPDDWIIVGIIIRPQNPVTKLAGLQTEILERFDSLEDAANRLFELRRWFDDIPRRYLETSQNQYHNSNNN